MCRASVGKTRRISVFEQTLDTHEKTKHNICIEKQQLKTNTVQFDKKCAKLSYKPTASCTSQTMCTCIAILTFRDRCDSVMSTVLCLLRSVYYTCV